MEDKAAIHRWEEAAFSKWRFGASKTQIIDFQNATPNTLNRLIAISNHNNQIISFKTQSQPPPYNNGYNQYPIRIFLYVMNKKIGSYIVEFQGSSLDMINNLPHNIIQTMLTFLPMRDAFKTSLLSRNWRYHCINIPKLKFDDELFRESSSNRLSIKCKLLHVVYPILLLHQGVILEFSLCISQLTSCCEIDQIIFHLSRNPTVNNFTLSIESGDDHKLLSSFFTLKQLTHLKLQNCAFHPPSTFSGFSMLTSLYFHNVGITVKVLLRFISNCPLLKSFTLIEDERHAIGCWNSDFVELFECLPLIEHLHMSAYPVKCFAKGVMPQKLPVALIHLRVLNLSGLCFAKEVELRSALLLITSSPNIEKIKMEMCYTSEVSTNLLELEDYCYGIMNRLRELEIRNMSNKRSEMEFVKLILGKSPMLKKVGIVIDYRVTMNDEVKMLRELLKYQHASTNAKIIFE